MWRTWEKIRLRPSFCSPKFRNNLAAESAPPWSGKSSEVFRASPWRFWGSLWKIWVVSMWNMCKNGGIREYSCKDPQGSLIQLLAVGQSQNPPTLGIPESVGQTLLELWQVWERVHSLGSCSSAQHPRGEGFFPIFRQESAPVAELRQTDPGSVLPGIHISLPCISMASSDSSLPCHPSMAQQILKFPEDCGNARHSSSSASHPSHPPAALEFHEKQGRFPAGQQEGLWQGAAPWSGGEGCTGMESGSSPTWNNGIFSLGAVGAELDLNEAFLGQAEKCPGSAGNSLI